MESGFPLMLSLSRHIQSSGIQHAKVTQAQKESCITDCPFFSWYQVPDHYKWRGSVTHYRGTFPHKNILHHYECLHKAMRESQGSFLHRIAEPAEEKTGEWSKQSRLCWCHPAVKRRATKTNGSEMCMSFLHPILVHWAHRTLMVESKVKVFFSQGCQTHTHTPLMFCSSTSRYNTLQHPQPQSSPGVPISWGQSHQEIVP